MICKIMCCMYIPCSSIDPRGGGGISQLCLYLVLPPPTDARHHAAVPIPCSATSTDARHYADVPIRCSAPPPHRCLALRSCAYTLFCPPPMPGITQLCLGPIPFSSPPPMAVMTLLCLYLDLPLHRCPA